MKYPDITLENEKSDDTYLESKRLVDIKKQYQ